MLVTKLALEADVTLPQKADLILDKEQEHLLQAVQHAPMKKPNSV